MTTGCKLYSLELAEALHSAQTALACLNLVSITIIHSVSNSSGPALWVRVGVGTDLFPIWRSRSSIHPNHQFRYGSMDISQPV